MGPRRGRGPGNRGRGPPHEPGGLITAADPRGPTISVILVNFATTDLALDCLRSVRENFTGAPYEVIVVDNATPGFTSSEITDPFPETRVILNPTNLGFGLANNAGAREARGSYLWLLNPDTLLPPDHNLGVVMSFLESHPGHAAASPLLVDPQGTVQPGQRASFPRLLRMIAEKPARLLAKALPGTRNLLKAIDPDLSGVVEADVPVVVAASLFIRASSFWEVGGFSSEFFMFLEDSDLCRKLAQHGYLVRFMPQAKVIHLWGKSIKSQHERKALYYQSQDIYLRKWCGRGEAYLSQLLRIPFAWSYRRARYR